jgi:hypothetical protein
MARSRREDRGGGSRLGAQANQAGVGAAAGGEAERVEDDRFAGAGRAGQRRQAGPEGQV